MNKDISYHRSAIQYNEELAVFAEDLSKRLENPEVARWARSVAKQHQFHANRHTQALTRMESAPEENDSRTEHEKLADESEGVAYMHPSNPDVVDEVVHRSAIDGQFVTAEEADANPDTTVEEHVEIPVGPETAEVQA